MDPVATFDLPRRSTGMATIQFVGKASSSPREDMVRTSRRRSPSRSSRARDSAGTPIRPRRPNTIVSGTGELHRDDGVFPVRPGSVFVLPTNVRHDLVNTSTETLRAVGFFSAAMFTQIFDNVMQPFNSHVLGTPNREGKS